MDNNPTFRDAAAAAAWAEEVLAKQGLGSQLGRLNRKFGYGEMTADEACDFAHTIVMIVSGYPLKIQATAFSYVYGREDHHRESALVEDLTRRMIDYLLAQDVELKPTDKLRDLSIATLRSQREMYLFGRHHPMARIARFMRMSPNTFKDKKSVWPELYGMTRTSVRHWVDSATKGLDCLLRERGFVV